MSSGAVLLSSRITNPSRFRDLSSVAFVSQSVSFSSKVSTFSRVARRPTITLAKRSVGSRPASSFVSSHPSAYKYQPETRPCSSSILSTRKAFATMSAASSAPFKFKIALCQISVGADKSNNLLAAKTKIESAVKEHGVKLVMLPECFNCPYGNQFFKEYAERLPDVGATLEETSASPTVHMLCEAAKASSIYIVGGSIPEKSSEDGQERIFNTSIVVSPKGQVIAKHRKIHLFDINVPGGIKFVESDTLSPGKSVTTFNMTESPGNEKCKVGVAICYDIRFPELSMIMAEEGCSLICVPGAFNMTTGPAHWELLGRARALDNQLYVAMCSPARDKKAPYTAWGHSSVIDPWGTVIATTEEREDVVIGEIDEDRLTTVRKSIPVRDQKRKDIYELKKSKL